MAVRHFWTYSLPRQRKTVDLPANDDLGNDLVEIDVSDPTIVGVRVYTESDGIQYCTATDTDTATTGADAQFTAKEYMILPSGIEVIAVNWTGADPGKPEKLYIRGNANSTTTSDGLSYEILRGG